MNTIDIKIMDRSFSIKCPTEKVSELQKSAQHLEEKMLQIQGGNKSVSVEKIAVIAALNITHEAFVNTQQNAINANLVISHILDLQNKITAAIAK
jgi:cell division protein ZapA